MSPCLCGSPAFLRGLFPALMSLAVTEAAYVSCTVHAASSGLVSSPNPIAAIPFARASGKDYFRTTIFFPASMMHSLAVVAMDTPFKSNLIWLAYPWINNINERKRLTEASFEVSPHAGMGSSVNRLHAYSEKWCPGLFFSEMLFPRHKKELKQLFVA